jgi:hypothetical protein
MMNAKSFNIILCPNYFCKLYTSGRTTWGGVGGDGEYIETKLRMFADDTQLFNKNDESVKNLLIF